MIKQMSAQVKRKFWQDLEPSYNYVKGKFKSNGTVLTLLEKVKMMAKKM